MSFKDRVVIVTGGSNGIGMAIVEAYAEQDARVIIADIDGIKGKELEAELLQKDNVASFIQCDLRLPEDITHVMEETIKLYGKIDILINNAGKSVWKSPYELTVDEWDELIHTNLRSTFLYSREAALRMRNHDGGKIVNIASTRAFMSEPNSEAYAASKGGIVALTHAFAASLSADNIQVNCISPGWIQNESYENLREVDHQQHWSNRVGKPSDIANACLFLTKEDNAFINGTNLTIDGGITKKMIYEP